MSSTPKISVIVPVYNVEKYIRRCLDSIQTQTFTDWECICIDDGTPDNSGKICDEYAEKDSRFVVLHKENGGVSSARNAGLDVAKGEWITFVDSDDWCCSNMLEILLRSAKKNNADVVVAGFSLNDGTVDYEIHLPIDGKMVMPKDFVFCNPWAKLFKRDVLYKNNIWFPLGITLAEDLLFTFKVYFYTQNVYGVTNSCYHYYQNKNSVCHTVSKKNVDDENLVVKEIENLLKKNNAVSDWNSFLNYKKLEAKNKYIFCLKEPDFKSWKDSFSELPNKFIIKKTFSLPKKLIVIFAIFRLYYFSSFLLFLGRKVKKFFSGKKSIG